MKLVRVGIIGTSWWADAMYLPSLAGTEKATVVACCGRNEERAREGKYMASAHQLVPIIPTRTSFIN
jgi:predicted dehydrogenase